MGKRYNQVSYYLYYWRSTGSASLNALIFPLISRLTEKYFIIHQTGRLSFDQAIRIKQKNYVMKDYFEIDEVAWIFQHAALVVGRSGANTVMEIAMTGNIGLLIPLPWSGGGEQMKNAQWLEKQRTAVILPQAEASPERLMQNIQKILRARTVYGDRAKKLSLSIQRDGAKQLINEVARFL
jgi:UDP-N-acetylglucosamine--N-acetylmuramyl-(pentapeptide) pyrophosphoryl-undecaprenol N-acetylglucosamine transferase